MGTKSFLVCLLLTALVSLTHAGLVKKMLRHRRETLTPPGGDNITLPSADQPVVFNHVYNINVPAGSLCSVDLDSPGGTELEAQDAAPSSGFRTTEHTLDGENQIVFTHRINIPRQACSCTDGLPDLKDLLSRLEMLEGEVSTLRDQCATGDAGCCSAHQVTGEVGTKPYCNGHGNYSADVCGCSCEPGWKGPNCTESECPNDCQDQGRCVDGKCVCFEGFSGEDCSLYVCPVDCGENGQCLNGICVCAEGFTGEDCSQTNCLNNCLGRGKCVDEECRCDEPWTGFDCSELICPNDCYDRGRCINGTCYCDEGFTGEDCGEQTCPNDCLGNGFCVDGQCVCSAGYTGEDCSKLTCPNDCNERGTCFNGMCICDTGYQGEDCSQLACPNNCHNRGQCVNGQCVCDVGFQGEDCSELSCPNNCLNRGQCVNGQCVCEEGFAGEDCSIKTCPSDCYGRGDCVNGQCVCYAGFTGEDCSVLSCPNNCLNRGQCIDGLCVCDEGFTEEDCSQKACPNDCLGRGYCVDGKCVCQEGYSGEDCSELTCPDNCNNRGRCVNGKCMCEEAYVGDNCGELGCLNNCQDSGRCVNGQCVCDEGYIGQDCSEVSPPKDLTVTEVTTETVDLTWNNEMLVTEYLVTYSPTSPGGLLVEFTVPGDRTAATVKELEPGIEYQINVYAILSNKKSIPVSARVATYLPQPEGLKFKTVRETSVEVQWDQLDISFDGWELYFRNTKETNGKILSTLPSSQTTSEQQGLGPGQEYEVSLGIIKNNTRGPQTTKTIMTRIDGPRQVEVEDVTDSSALVTWLQPVAQVDGVTVSYGPSSDSSDKTNVEISSLDKQYSIDGLSPDTEYQISLVSRRGDMTSMPVSETFTTDLDAPRDLQTLTQTVDGFTLEWRNSEADVDSYRIKYSPISGGSHGEELFPCRSGATTQATITGLKPGTEYGIGVTAVKSERESLPATTNAATDLDAPKDLEVSESTETSMTLVWRRPRAKITIYRLVFISRDGRREEVEVPATATTYILPNLIPGMLYTITLTAERGQKKSAPTTLSASTAPKSTSPDVIALSVKNTPTSQSALATGAVHPTVVPLIPLNTEKPSSFSPTGVLASGAEPEGSSLDLQRDLNVTDVTSTSVKLAWSAPEEAFDSFLVELNALSGMAQAHVTAVPGSARKAQIAGLSPGIRYEVSLYGMVEREQSLPLRAFVKTEELRPQVVNLTVSDITWDSFNVSWSTENGDFESFVIEVTNLESGLESQNLTLSGDALSLGISGLSDNTTYMIALYGVHQDSFQEPVYTEASTVSEPVVGNLYVSNLTSESFSISWNGTEGDFDGYILEIIDSDWQREPEEYNISHNAMSHDIAGLRPSTDYIAYLYGIVKGSRTHAVSTVASTAAEPDLSRLVVSNITSDRFSLSWRTGEKAFDNFVVEVRESAMPSHAMGRTLSGGARSTVMAGLKGSTSYNIKLYTSSGGQNTPPLFAVATTEAVPQLGPIAVSDISQDNFTLSWSTLAGHFDGFVIRVTDSEQLFDTLEFRPSGEVSNITIPGLADATAYDIELYGISHGRRTPSLLAHTVTAPLPRVEKLTILDITPYGFRVSWEVHQQQEGAPPGGGFSHFQIVVSDSGWLLEPQEFSVPGNQSHLDIWGLITGIGYEVRLTGVSRSGLHSRSLTTVAVTEAEPEVEHMFISDITPESFRLSWTADEDMFDRFVIKIRDSKKVAHPQEFNVLGDERTKVLTGLTGGTEYEIELYGVTLERRSQSITGVARTGLGSPKGIHFSDVTDTSAILHWTLPRGQVDSYRIMYSAHQGGSPMTVTVDGTESQALLPNMVPGLTYQATVIAVKGLEESDPGTATVTTDLGSPKGIHFSDVTDTSAILHWTLLRGQVDSYRIIYSAHQGGSPMTVTVDGTESQALLPNMVPGLTYQATVIAVKGLEESDPGTATVTTDLGSPKGIHFSDVTDTSAILHWTLPRGQVDSYRIIYSAHQGGSPMTVTVDGTESQALLPNMVPGLTYQATVIAVKGLEESDPGTDTVTTALDKPQGLTAVNITDTTALLLWQPARATVDGYVITYSADSVSPVVEHVSGNTVEFEMGSLVPATHYTVGVYAMREDQKSASATTEFTTDVDAPRDLAAINVQTDSATLTWTPPRAVITGYVLTFSSPDGTIREVVLSPTATSYSMSQLSGSTEYSVRLQAMAGAQRSHRVTTVFTTIGVLYRHAKDCAQALLNGETTSGLYTIYLGGDANQPVQVYCDMTTDGGGWTVFLRRQSGKLEFFRNWKNYTGGFGDMNDEFWLGLSNLHKITTAGEYELRVDLRDNGEEAFAQYDKFSIAEPRTRYKIYMGAYSGTAGDSMTYHQGRPFSTYDNDNDIAVTNCALSYNGAFWYKNCHRVNLMGRYGDISHSKGINWFHWKGHEYSIQFAEMKFRPINFRNFESRRKRS